MCNQASEHHEDFWIAAGLHSDMYNALQAVEEGLESRVLVVSCRSPLENAETLNYKDLNFTIRPYGAGAAYAQSKVALSLWATDLASR